MKADRTRKIGSKNIVITSANTGDHHASTEWIEIDSLILLSNSLLQYIKLQSIK